MCPENEEGGLGDVRGGCDGGEMAVGESSRGYRRRGTRRVMHVTQAHVTAFRGQHAPSSHQFMFRGSNQDEY